MKAGASPPIQSLRRLFGIDAEVKIVFRLLNELLRLFFVRKPELALDLIFFQLVIVGNLLQVELELLLENGLLQSFDGKIQDELEEQRVLYDFELVYVGLLDVEGDDVDVLSLGSDLNEQLHEEERFYDYVLGFDLLEVCLSDACLLILFDAHQLIL